MKKSSIIIPLVILVLIAGATVVILHKPHKPAGTNTSSSAPKDKTNVPAVNNAVLITKTNAELGQYLAKPSGQALYTYSGDSEGVSKCTDSCIADWLPYQAIGSTANLPVGIGTIKRSDNGKIQYTYNGMPLYSFTGDSDGKVSGNGESGFTVAKPAAATSASQPADADTTSNTAGPQNSSSSNSNW